MRHCCDCQKYQNGLCTETGRVPCPSASCDKWRYRYEPLVFAVKRMRRAQKATHKDWKQLQEQSEYEAVVDKMLESIETEGEIKG
ncbi:MAG: hypothetical protein IKR81_13790 [Victivallales bacterium]|nr:hypothetical protein [Victivallales bacterium]